MDGQLGAAALLALLLFISAPYPSAALPTYYRWRYRCPDGEAFSGSARECEQAAAYLGLGGAGGSARTNSTAGFGCYVANSTVYYTAQQGEQDAPPDAVLVCRAIVVQPRPVEPVVCSGGGGGSNIGILLTAGLLGYTILILPFMIAWIVRMAGPSHHHSPHRLSHRALHDDGFTFPPDRTPSPSEVVDSSPMSYNNRRTSTHHHRTFSSPAEQADPVFVQMQERSTPPTSSFAGNSYTENTSFQRVLPPTNGGLVEEYELPQRVHMRDKPLKRPKSKPDREAKREKNGPRPEVLQDEEEETGHIDRGGRVATSEPPVTRE